MTLILEPDTFECKSVNKGGKFFDHVARIEGESENFGFHLLLDINSDLLQIKPPEKFSMALASNISLDKSEDIRTWDPSISPGPNRAPKASLMDRWDYVMYGKIFKIKEEGGTGHNLKISVTVSFGGLLLVITGEQRHLSHLQQDSRLYLLLKKI